MAKGPEYSDASDAIRLLRVATWFGPACFAMLSSFWYFMLNKGWISYVGFVFLLILNIPLTIAGILAIHRTVGATAVLMVKTMFADGDIPPPPTYPRQDVLIAQGKYAEAADWFRDHLRIEPGDHEARLRLAHLLEMRLNGHDEAERLYLEIRNAEPAASQYEQMRATNGLIDVYRKLGRTARLKVELARFVERYRGSALAAGAARELQELKEIDPTSGSRHFPT
ncbi:MAG TPA: tetratricopeptide repeat protein [Gemmatimonadales bacterium]|nr:tetratricopeptide repeat protein [Gemmatimonadales bacterium]